MSKILKNTTNADISIGDVGVTIVANSTYTIPEVDSLLWASSDDIIVHIGTGDIIVNDGTFDLSSSNGTKLIQGIYPTKLKLVGGTDETLIGNVGDALKFDGEITANVTTSEITGNAANVRVDASFQSISLNRANEPFTPVYSYTGTGKLYGFLVNFNSSNIIIKLSVDSNTILELDCENLNSLVSTGSEKGEFGWLQWEKTKYYIKFKPDYSLGFSSNVVIEAKANSNSNNRSVVSYIVDIVKES